MDDRLEVLIDDLRKIKKVIIALDAIELRLKYIMERDERTLSNPITEDGLYFDGVYDALKIVQEETQKIFEVKNEF